MILGPDGEPIGDVATLSEQQPVQRMIAELQACDEPLIFGPLAAFEALQLAGVLQLAQRHPHLSEHHRAIAAAVVDTVRAYFEGKPTILSVLERGDDPSQDVPA